jgi:hypothetical protein
MAISDNPLMQLAGDAPKLRSALAEGRRRRAAKPNGERHIY